MLQLTEITQFIFGQPLNRRVKMSRTWTDPVTGEPLGNSQWEGEKGVASTVIEYGENNLPSKVWREAEDILEFHYDGVNRPVMVKDKTGHSTSIEYDENSNPVRIERLGRVLIGEEQPFQQIINNEFDELDRLVTHTLNQGPPERIIYNSLNCIVEYKSETQASAKYLHDGFGRISGRATNASVPRLVNEGQSQQLLLERVEWDDNHRLITRSNAADHSTRYTYDVLNRLSSIIYADGTIRHFVRDGNGNIIRQVDPNGAIITNRFDEQNRLIERQIGKVITGSPQNERFSYDGLSRLVTAVTNSATTVRRYDSLSRLLEESQSGRVIKYERDSAGNCVRLIYPSGREVRKSYDSLNRVTEVRDGQSQLIASYSYGSGIQLLEQRLGKGLIASLTYEPHRDWLSSIIYRSAETGEIIEGTKRRYDAAGNRIEEVELRRGRESGERYFYDTANRLVMAQYGVKNLEDADSPIEKQVLYELSATGIWQQKLTRDKNRATLEQLLGSANQREAYLSLGDRHFEYDANGNRIFEQTGDEDQNTKNRYSYDYADRLQRVERIDTNGQIIQQIEYSYDAFNRQIVKRMVNADGTNVTHRTWDGEQLIEEWDGDRLARSFIYGAQSNDRLLMTVHTRDDVEEFFYALDGRGAVKALVDSGGHVVEQYHYDGLGRPLLIGQAEIDTFSLEDALPVSPHGNPLFANEQIWDGHAGIYFARQLATDAVTDQLLNHALGVEPPTLSRYNLLESRSDPGTDLERKESATFTGGVIGGVAGLVLGGIGGGLSGRVVGAAAGSTAGPWGVAAGTIGGGIAGAIAGAGVGWGIGKDIGAHFGGRDAPSSRPEGTTVRDPATSAPDIELGEDGSWVDNRTGERGGGPSSSGPNDLEIGEDGSWVDNRTGEQGGPSGFGSSNGGGMGSGGGPAPGSGCFIAGTPVLLGDGTTKPIDALKIGDYVASKDETTGNTSSQRVSRIWIHDVQRTLLLHLAGDEKVETTKAHRFFVTNKGFVGAGRLAPGTTLNTQSERSVRVAGIEPQEKGTTVYNLEVENFHTYFVGKNGVWVHNLKDDEGEGEDDWGEWP